MMPGWPFTMPHVPTRSRRRSWSISTRSSALLPHMSGCLCSPHPTHFLPSRPLWRGNNRVSVTPQRAWKGVADAFNQRSKDSKRLSWIKPSTARHRSVARMRRPSSWASPLSKPGVLISSAPPPASSLTPLKGCSPECGRALLRGADAASPACEFAERSEPSTSASRSLPRPLAGCDTLR
jgi:hypothetical protein